MVLDPEGRSRWPSCVASVGFSPSEPHSPSAGGGGWGGGCWRRWGETRGCMGQGGAVGRGRGGEGSQLKDAGLLSEALRTF